jgi:hypothetical protein
LAIANTWVPADQTETTPLRVSHLDLFACQLQRCWQPIEHAIVGDPRHPSDLALFGGEAFPSKVLWQGEPLLLGQTICRANMRGAMDAGVDALAPGIRLAIEIIQIRESDPTP